MRSEPRASLASRARDLAAVAGSALLAVAPWAPLRTMAAEVGPAPGFLEVAVGAARDVARAPVLLVACLAAIALTALAARSRGPVGAFTMHASVLGFAYAASAMSALLPPGDHVSVSAFAMLAICTAAAVYGLVAFAAVFVALLLGLRRR